MTQYYIHTTPVTPTVATIKGIPPNVLTYKGGRYHIICNGDGDCWIVIDGKKRFLEK